MNERELEPGFLQAFRFFVAIRIVFWIIIGPILVVVNMAQGASMPLSEIANLTLIERLTLPNIAPILVMEVALLLLLTLPQVARSLRSRFVPIMLVLALIPLLVGQYWWPAENPLQTPFVIFFFVMLVFIAWQYSFRYVLTYVLALTCLLYTSDAADDLPCVDLGGRRLIKKKNNIIKIKQAQYLEPAKLYI